MRYRVIDGKLVKVEEDDAPPLTKFSRRRFLEASFLAVGSTALAACGIPGFNATGVDRNPTHTSTGNSTGGGWFGTSGGGGGSFGGGGGSSGGGS
jgi:uncharacterized membrane protein YgcG